MTGKNSSQGLFPTRLRRPTLTHAFERALDDAFREVLVEATGASGEAEDAIQKFQSALDVLSGLASSRSYVAGSSLAAAYKAEPDDGTPVPEAPSARTIEPAPILRPGLSVEDLKRLRRRFALVNHPDRVPAELREEAAKAMARVNAEIDKALRRARAR